MRHEDCQFSNETQKKTIYNVSECFSTRPFDQYSFSRKYEKIQIISPKVRNEGFLKLINEKFCAIKSVTLKVVNLQFSYLKLDDLNALMICKEPSFINMRAKQHQTCHINLWVCELLLSE